ncbi:hypothetical protein LINGRAPRIM_LOCUS2753 [Linum grandiflorum]
MLYFCILTSTFLIIHILIVYLPSNTL